AQLRQRKETVRPSHRELPGHPVHARRHRHPDRSRPTSRLSSGDEGGRQGSGPDQGCSNGEAVCIGHGHEGDHGLRSAPRWVWLHQRLPCRADDARCKDHADLRGHQPDPESGHREIAAQMSKASPEPAGSSSVVELEPSPPPPPPAPPPAAPYHPPPPYSPPRLAGATPTDGRAIMSVTASIAG